MGVICKSSTKILYSVIFASGPYTKYIAFETYCHARKIITDDPKYSKIPSQTFRAVVFGIMAWYQSIGVFLSQQNLNCVLLL